MPDVNGDARRPQAVEHGLVADVAAGHAVPHLGEDDGDRRHPRAADADDVQPSWPGEVHRARGTP